ncbi:MAG: c-type cytochrome [Halofilum sp. (in: g-proteobacteria)]
MTERPAWPTWAARIAVLLGLLSWPVFAAADAPPDMAGRMRACTACHGSEGIRIEEGYVPRIEGKPAGYLFNQLVNFREHRRTHSTMNRLVEWMSDDYLAAMADWFARQAPPYPEPAAPPAREALRERGAQLVRSGDPDRDIPACQSCHGERLAGVRPNTPGLIGLPEHYIAGQLGSWWVGSRQAARPDCMATIVERMRERDIEAVAAWLASRPLPDDTRPAAEPPEDPPMHCGSVERPSS